MAGRGDGSEGGVRMAIYIEGIPMPKDGEHPVWITLHSDGTVEYNANKGDGWQMTTAVSISPHGRLINADALKENWSHRDLDLFAQGWGYLKDLNRAPTIIPASEEEMK